MNCLIPKGWQRLGGNNFDAIRLAMALLVVWSHSFALTLGTEDREPLSLLLNGTYNSGNLAVMVFFMVSGFLITHSYSQSPTLWQFLEKRVRRIHPGYLFATAVCAFVISPLFATHVDLSLTEVVKTLGANLLLRNYFPPSDAFAANPVPGAVNGSLWSIPFEFWCYLGVASLGLAGLLTSRFVIALATVVLLLGRIGLDVVGMKPGGGLLGVVIGWPYLWFVIGPSFLLGMCAFAFQADLPRSRYLLGGLLFTAVAAPYVNAHLAHLVVAPALAYTVFYSAFSNTITLHRAAYYGDFSYGTYLYAFPIQQMLVVSHGQSFGFGTFAAFSMIFSLLAGVVSWHGLEKWFVRRRS